MESNPFLYLWMVIITAWVALLAFLVATLFRLVRQQRELIRDLIAVFGKVTVGNKLKQVEDELIRDGVLPQRKPEKTGR